MKRIIIRLLVLFIMPILIQGCEGMDFGPNPDNKQVTITVEMTNSHSKAAWVYVFSDSLSETENPQTMVQPGAKRTVTIRVFSNYAKNQIDFSARDNDAWSVTGLANFVLDTRKYKTEDELKAVVVRAVYTGAPVMTVTAN